MNLSYPEFRQVVVVSVLFDPQVTADAVGLSGLRVGDQTGGRQDLSVDVERGKGPSSRLRVRLVDRQVDYFRRPLLLDGPVPGPPDRQLRHHEVVGKAQSQETLLLLLSIDRLPLHLAR